MSSMPGDRSKCDVLPYDISIASSRSRLSSSRLDMDPQVGIYFVTSDELLLHMTTSHSRAWQCLRLEYDILPDRHHLLGMRVTGVKTGSLTLLEPTAEPVRSEDLVYACARMNRERCGGASGTTGGGASDSVLPVCDVDASPDDAGAACLDEAEGEEERFDLEGFLDEVVSGLVDIEETVCRVESDDEADAEQEGLPPIPLPAGPPSADGDREWQAETLAAIDAEIGEPPPARVGEMELRPSPDGTDGIDRVEATLGMAAACLLCDDAAQHVPDDPGSASSGGPPPPPPLPVEEWTMSELGYVTSHRPQHAGRTLGLVGYKRDQRSIFAACHLHPVCSISRGIMRRNISREWMAQWLFMGQPVAPDMSRQEKLALGKAHRDLWAPPPPEQA